MEDTLYNMMRALTEETIDATTYLKVRATSWTRHTISVMVGCCWGVDSSAICFPTPARQTALARAVHGASEAQQSSANVRGRPTCRVRVPSFPIHPTSRWRVLRRCVCACAVYKFINSIKKENAMISKSSSSCVDHKMAGGAVGEGCGGERSQHPERAERGRRRGRQREHRLSDGSLQLKA